MELDSANFRRSLLSDAGWVIPTGRRAQPGSSGGKPAELFRAGRMWRHGGPIRQPEPGEARRGRDVRAVVYDRYGPTGRPPGRGRRAAGSRSGRSPRQDPRLYRHEDGLRISQRRGLPLPLLHRHPPAETEDPRARIRRRGRRGRRSRHRVRRRRPRLRRDCGRACGVRLRAGDRSGGAHAGGRDLRRGGVGLRRCQPRPRLPADGRRPERPKRARLRRLRSRRHSRGAAREAVRRRRHGRVRHEERRARALAWCRPRDRPHCRRTSRRTARRTTSSSTPSASSRSGAADAR